MKLNKISGAILVVACDLPGLVMTYANTAVTKDVSGAWVWKENPEVSRRAAEAQRMSFGQSNPSAKISSNVTKVNIESVTFCASARE